MPRSEPSPADDAGDRSQVGFVIAAGGSGTRFGGPVPKTRVNLNGKPVWRWSCDRIRRTFPGSPIVVVVPDGDEAYFTSDSDDVAATHAVDAWTIVAGGDSRAGSVRNGLDALARLASVPQWVAVHDAARALVSAADLRSVVDAAALHGAAILAAPVTSTVKRVSTHPDAADPSRTVERITETIDRGSLRLAQTPQVARLDWLLDAFVRPAAAASTDEASALEHAGYEVAVVPGSPLNFKITTAADLLLAEALCDRIDSEPA